MSKKCCGMIYSDDEKVCKVCGKALDDAETVTDKADESKADESKADETDNTEEEAYDTEDSTEDSTEDDTEDSTEDRHLTSDGKVDYLKKHIEREAILDQIFEDNGYKKNDVIKEEKEKVPFKGAAIFTLILAVLGLALIGALVYFIVLNPYYIKSGEADKKLDYPQLASTSDAEELATLLEPYGATATDAQEE